MVLKHYPNPFEPLTPALAWVAGLWFSDGWICKFPHRRHSAALAQKDLELLESVKALIAPRDDPDRPKLSVSRSSKAKGAFSNSAIPRLTIHSVQFVSYLEALGIRPRKSLTMAWPSWPKGELLSHFVRGLWDGDGFIYTSEGKRDPAGGYLRAGYGCGSRSFVEALRDVITPVVKRRLNVHHYQRNTYRLITTGSMAHALCSWMYKGSTEKTRLRRKYEVYMQQRRRTERCSQE